MITWYDVTQHIVAAVEYLIVREWPFSYYDHVVWRHTAHRCCSNSKRMIILLLLNIRLQHRCSTGWSRGTYRHATHRCCSRIFNSKRMIILLLWSRGTKWKIYIYVIHNFTIGKYYCCFRLFHRNSHFIQTSYNLKGSETRYITDLALCWNTRTEFCSIMYSINLFALSAFCFLHLASW